MDAPTGGPDESAVSAFIERWRASSGQERANYALFLGEFCDIVGVDRPNPARDDGIGDHYRFERLVTFNYPDGSTSQGRIDLYKRGCFVLEAKQGSDANAHEALPLFGGDADAPRRTRARARGTKSWNAALTRARVQAENYAKALPPAEGWPPFLIVLDVGDSFTLYADFTQSGKSYSQFPDTIGFRIPLADLVKPDVRDLLRAVWLDPLSLDPSRRAAKVTREIARHLADMARALEKTYAPERVATFLMRCLFTLFAEDVGLLPNQKFIELLKDSVDDPPMFTRMVGEVWQRMNEGGFSVALRQDVLRFNGKLFEDADVLPLPKELIGVLLEAAKADWRDVEPAIFGTLLERALDPVERHKLGAHYTPRAYVERLVIPTVIEPLRADFENVRTAAVGHANKGDVSAAVKEVTAFHKQLCQVRILDPACGSGNFLYVAMEHMKRLEGEVIDLLRQLGESAYADYVKEMDRHAVDPHQFLGIEINPRAAAITELVLWIGYLQWHFRTRGRTMPAEPVLKKFSNIECRDAVLACDGEELVRDEHGKLVSRWDGRTFKRHPITGEDVPDETARVEIKKLINPRPAAWPEAEFIVGNPPYIGDKVMKATLGEGYVQALRSIKDYKSTSPSSDYVMYWWDKAACALGKTTKRFGLITTNSIKQKYNSRTIAHFLSGHKISLIWVIPDHPWVDSLDGAQVRVAMTVAKRGKNSGMLLSVIKEMPLDTGEYIIGFTERYGMICPDLTVGSAYGGAESLKANGLVCCPGVKLFGQGFILDQKMLTLIPEEERKIVKPYYTAQDSKNGHKGRYVIDAFGISEACLLKEFPYIYQHLNDRVRPFRRNNNRPSYQEKWWLFGEPRAVFRRSYADIERIIVTMETSRRRWFAFLPSNVVVEGTCIIIASADSFVLGVVSSKIHLAWARGIGGRLGVGNDPRYNKTRCFDLFPFPECDETTKFRIRDLGEALDRHRKERQRLFPDLTITGMYNVLAKLRAGEALTPAERQIHEAGLVSVLKQIHDDLDAAVFEAYGWPADLSDEDILARLVALNRERAEEERNGLIRWLRPEFQAPQAKKPVQTEMDVEIAPALAATSKIAWPKATPDQVRLLRQALAARTAPASPRDLARSFRRAPTGKVEELLRTLSDLGHVHQTEAGTFVAMMAP